jgi:hypothetical protein
MGWASHAKRMGAIRNLINIVIGKPKEKRPFGRPRHRWEGFNWMYLAQDREQWWALVNAVMIFRFHKRLEIS